MKLSLITHRGAVRAQNQDALQIGRRVWIGDMEGPEELAIGRFPELVSVIDGMGGLNGGERAAEILAQVLADGSEEIAPELDPERDERVLSGILKTAEARMCAESRAIPSLSGMGAVVAGLIIRERSVTAFNCGDSRAYRLSGGELEKLTHDHSVVQELRDRDEIDEDALRTHPMKNMVLSAISAGSKDFRLFVKCVSRCEGDAFFVCSDGVWEALEAARLARRLADPSPEAARQLFKDLLDAQCADNVSFVLLR